MAEQAIAEARPSAREVMGNIWDELEAKANEREQAFAEEDEQPEDQADVSHETDVEQAEEVDEADKDEPEEEEPMEAPASWSKDDREVWARLDRDTQEIIRRRPRLFAELMPVIVRTAEVSTLFPSYLCSQMNCTVPVANPT